MTRSPLQVLAVVAVVFVGSIVTATAQTGGRGGIHGAFGARGGHSTSPRLSSPARGTSVIRDGTGGFSVYSQSGISRHLGPPQGSSRVYHRGGAISPVIGDGRGGGTVYTPGRSHTLYGNSPLARDRDGDE